MPDKSSLGDRIKKYEQATGSQLLPGLPMIARLDGRAFHTLCRKMQKPHDNIFSSLMRATTIRLVTDFHPDIGYTQSDEITLVWDAPQADSEPLFGGRVQKLTSVLAGLASGIFNRMYAICFPAVAIVPVFDCRVFNVPSQWEAVNCLIWRENDAVRNSVLSLAQAHFSHKEMHGKKLPELHDMLHGIGLNWNDLPVIQKRGAYVVRRLTVVKGLQADAIRSSVQEVVWDWPLSKIANPTEVIFQHAPPVSKAQEDGSPMPTDTKATDSPTWAAESAARTAESIQQVGDYLSRVTAFNGLLKKTASPKTKDTVQ